MKIKADKILIVDPSEVEVYLNGVKQKLCTEADTEEGYVILVMTNEDGSLKIVNGQLQKERLEGDVKLVIEKRK